MSYKKTEEILKKLNVSDNEKIDWLMGYAIKNVQKRLANLELNLRDLKERHEENISGIKDRISDLDIAYNDSFFDIQIDELATRQSTKKVSNEYVDKIVNCYSQKGLLEDKISELESRYQVKLKQFFDEKENLNKIIEELSK